MAADRVPQSGQVWVLRHLRALGRGRVTICDDTTVDRVHYRYHGTGTENTSTLEAFVTAYDYLAATELVAIDEHGPQVRPAERRIEDMRPRLGSAVT